MRYKATCFFHYFLIICITGTVITSCNNLQNEELEITATEYRNKMKGAWTGQMAGVGWGLPTEFDFIDSLIPPEAVPVWEPDMVNQQGNDDLYVEMTFLSSMEKYGLDVSIRQAGIDFANTGYTLWAANQQGRENLRYGIAPPESGHPKYNKHADDIDYQIEADFSGIISPGMPNVVVALGEKFGRLMNYGDGLYGGQFVGGMYSAAYFEKDIHKVIEAGLSCIPEESLYAGCIRDVVQWHKENPEDFEKTWDLIMDKYYRTLKHQPFAREHEEAWEGIDSKINGAFIVMGLLYGEGDMEKTIIYSMRCGLDSDCNPSNAAGVLGTMMGYDAIPDKFKSGLNMERKFSYSNYTFNRLMELSEKFTREFITRNDGSINVNGIGEEVFSIVRQKPEPSAFNPSYSPGDYNPDNNYSDQEMDQILAWSAKHFEPAADTLGVSLQVFHCGKIVTPGLTNWNHTSNVLRTAPMSRDRSVRLILKEKYDSVQPGRKAFLSFKAGHGAGESWRLVIKDAGINLDTLINEKNSKQGWVAFELPLSDENEITVNLEAYHTENEAINYWSNFLVNYE